MTGMSKLILLYESLFIKFADLNLLKIVYKTTLEILHLFFFFLKTSFL